MTGHLVPARLREDRLRGPLEADNRGDLAATLSTPPDPPFARGGKWLCWTAGRCRRAIDRIKQPRRWASPTVLAAGRCRARARLHPLVRNGPGRTELEGGVVRPTPNRQSVLSSLTIRWLVTHESTESIGMSTIVGWSRLPHFCRRGLCPPIFSCRAIRMEFTHTRVRKRRAQVRLEITRG